MNEFRHWQMTENEEMCMLIVIWNGNKFRYISLCKGLFLLTCDIFCFVQHTQHMICLIVDLHSLDFSFSLKAYRQNALLRFDAPTKAGKQVMPNIECAWSQRHTRDSGFRLSQMTLYFMTNFLISDILF